MPPPEGAPPPQDIKEAFSRRARMKKRGRADIMNDKLRLYELLQAERLSGVLVDAAVWLICTQRAVHHLDSICLGNLDGGHQMTEHIKNVLQSTGVDCNDRTATVRLRYVSTGRAVLDLPSPGP